MLAIRMQRTGRRGHAQFRVIVQDSRFSPSSGRVVAYLGSYDPHSKVAILDSTKSAGYLEKGAQPSDRVARLFQKEGINLPKWVKLAEQKDRKTRKPEKRRSTTPAPAEKPEEVVEAEASAELVEQPTEAEPTQVEEVTKAPAEQIPEEFTKKA